MPAEIRSRYAPSPTGPLHLGNLRTALLAWLHTRLQHGTFILRVEDLDQPRCRPRFVEQLIADLHWLGLDWDEGPGASSTCGPYLQSQRQAYYEHALQSLIERGHVFPCSCSRKDVATALSAPHGSGTLYPGTCRQRSPELAGRTAEPLSWRFRVGKREIRFHDELLGQQTQNLAREVGDFVVKRRDGLFAYQLAVVVDDHLMGVTDVVRGADLMDSTARQIALIEALDFARPRYWHVPLLRDPQGRRLAKRDRAQSLEPLRDRGATAAQIVGRLAHSAGLIDRDEPLSAAELLKTLTLETFTRRLRDTAAADIADSGFRHHDPQ